MVRAYVDTGQNHDDQFEKAPVISSEAKKKETINKILQTSNHGASCYYYCACPQTQEAPRPRRRPRESKSRENAQPPGVSDSCHTGFLVVWKPNRQSWKRKCFHQEQSFFHFHSSGNSRGHPSAEIGTEWFK